MTTQILPANLLTPPAVPAMEMEGLILQASPHIENNEGLVGELAMELKTAVEYFLIAYRQTVYLADNFNNYSPGEVLQIIEGIHSYKAMAEACLNGRKTLTTAFRIWVANMDIENGTTQTVH